jgi:RNA polymerase sigma factor (sigma-70 family)
MPLPLAELLARVERTARGVRQPWLPHDELVAVGNLELVRCLRAYEEERGAFWPWAHVRIRGAMLDAVRAWTGCDRHTGRQVRCASLPVSEDGEELLCDERGRDVVAELDLRQALGGLAPRYRAVVLRHALGGYSLREIGEAAGLTESRICQMWTAARGERAGAVG